MKNNLFLFLIVLFLFNLTACQSKIPEISVPTLTPLPTYTEQATLTLRPTYTALATFTASIVPTKTIQPTITPTHTEVPTYTPWPTLTKLPTQSISSVKSWVTITPYPIVTIQAPSQMNDVWSAGGLSISPVFNPPQKMQVISGRFSAGAFIMMRVRLWSNSGQTYAPLSADSFVLHGSLYGTEVTYLLDADISTYANSRVELWSLDRSIESSGFETNLVFDIHPDTKNLVLDFCPLPSGETEPLGCVSFPLPALQ